MNNEFVDYKCKICDTILKNRKAFGMHLSKHHIGYNIEKYVLEYYLNNQKPVCKCGCNKVVNWHKTLYRYNDYINGHNESVFKKGVYKETDETKQKRILSIKKTYEAKGKQIKNKISKSLIETFSDEDQKKRMSEQALNLWKDEEHRKRVSEGQKRAWAKNYDERCAKIFTDEFRANLSKLNMERDKIVKSKKEEFVFEKIKNIFNDAQSDFWIKLEERYKCYDVYIPSLNLLIELDGKYWHGLDRDCNFTKDQLLNMKNDLIKNRITDLDYDLIRINIDDLQDNEIFNSIEDLYNVSYFIKSKNLSKGDMFKFKNNKHALYTKEWVIKQNIKDKDWTENVLLDLLTDYFDEYVKSNGWFYPVDNSKIDDIILKIKSIDFDLNNTEFNLKNNNYINDYLKSIFKSFWNVDNGPVKSWSDKNKLKNVIKYRLGLNNSKLYSYNIDNNKIETNETFDISPHNIIRGFIVQKHSVSWFKPVTAAEIYNYFLNTKKNPVVWDPSMGFGARMLGFCAKFNKGTYFGTDPSTQTFKDLEILKNELENNSDIFSGNINIFNIGSENFNNYQNIGDFVFTSPPYFDIEKYFDEQGQCWRDYSDIDVWQDKYLYKTFENAFNFLKEDGIMCINISENYKDIFVKTANKANFKLKDIFELSLKTDHFSKKNEKTKKNELILIFNK